MKGGGGHYGENSASTRDFFCHAGAGAAAGTIAATFVCPLDVIKTRLQVHGLPPGHKGSIIVTSLRNIMETEGLRGLYRGLSPTIIALLPNWAVLMGSCVSNTVRSEMGFSQAYEDLANRIVKKLKKEAVEPSPVLN